MGVNASTGRRWLGAVFLGGALAMLVLGETALQNRLGPVGFLLYWIACLLLTGFSVLIALWDLRAVRRQTREAERDLISTTLKDIQSEAKGRVRPPTKAE